MPSDVVILSLLQELLAKSRHGRNTDYDHQMEASQGSYPYLIGAQLWQLFRRQTRGLAAHIV